MELHSIYCRVLQCFPTARPACSALLQKLTISEQCVLGGATAVAGGVRLARVALVKIDQVLQRYPCGRVNDARRGRGSRGLEDSPSSPLLGNCDFALLVSSPSSAPGRMLCRIGIMIASKLQLHASSQDKDISEKASQPMQARRGRGVHLPRHTQHSTLPYSSTPSSPRHPSPPPKQ